MKKKEKQQTYRPFYKDTNQIEMQREGRNKFCAERF